MRKIIMASITAVVVVAVLAGTLIPILDDATATSDTYKNDGYFFVDTYDVTSEDTLTIEWDHTAPQQLTVEGETVDLSTISVNQAVTVLATSDLTLLRYTQSSSATTLQTFGGTSITCSTTNGYDLTVEITGTSAVFTSTGADPATVTLTNSPVYYACADGEYVMKNKDKAAYLNSDSEVFGMGTSVISSIGGRITKLTGSIDDGFTGSVIYPTTGFTSGDVTPTYTEDSDHDDLYLLEKCVWTVTDTSNVTTTVTYSYFIVPYEVTAERAVHFTDGENAIFNAIPVIVIVALLLAVVALVLRSRMD